MPRDRGPRRRRFGDFGERVAASHLEAKGYAIVERNWSTKEGEIDLIAQRGPNLVFVEVRSRQGRAMGGPEESINGRKAQGAVPTQTKEVAPRQKAVLLSLPEVWRDDTTAWSMEVLVRTTRGESYKNRLDWK